MSTSGNQENASITTSTLSPEENGPHKFIWRELHGFEGISVSHNGVVGLGGATDWQARQFLTRLSTCWSTLGHQAFVRNNCLVFTTPWWPWCAMARVWCLNACGMTIRWLRRTTPCMVTVSSHIPVGSHRILGLLSDCEVWEEQLGHLLSLSAHQTLARWCNQLGTYPGGVNVDSSICSFCSWPCNLPMPSKTAGNLALSTCSYLQLYAPFTSATTGVCDLFSGLRFRVILVLDAFFSLTASLLFLLEPNALTCVGVNKICSVAILLGNHESLRY